MNILRQIAFEINKECDLGDFHAKFCPNKHPERYLYSKSLNPIDEELIYQFWKWAVKVHHFRGLINWSCYNEPTLALDRIYKLMDRIKFIDPYQPFQIITNKVNIELPGFDLVRRSRYGQDDQSRMGDLQRTKLDNRIASIRGEGKPYNEMPKIGRCARGLGFSIDIDYYGNWGLCCNDWRCEEAVGSICNTNWDDMYEAWKDKSKTIQWSNEEEYNNLPRMCRSCLDVNPILSAMGGI
jgi:hypothetical protein